MATDVYLVRHGETEWSNTGQHTGSTDLPLLPEGEEQGRLLGRLLAGIRFAAVWSSDLQRARRTAELAGLRPEVTPLLREFGYGAYEGRTSDEIWRERPGWQLFVDGCPGGESPAQVAARARTFLAGLDPVEGAVAVFSHGHFVRALAMAWTDLDIAAAGSLAVDTASIGLLHDGSRGRVIQRWNWAPELAPGAGVHEPPGQTI
jgi:broad specificity phosphatase PhoE